MKGKEGEEGGRGGEGENAGKEDRKKASEEEGEEGQPGRGHQCPKNLCAVLECKHWSTSLKSQSSMMGRGQCA